MDKFCEYCGGKISAGAKFCEFCGGEVKTTAVVQDTAKEIPDNLKKLLKLSGSLDYIVAICAILTSLVFVLAAIMAVFIGVPLLAIVIGIFFLLGGVVCGFIAFSLWGIAIAHFKSGKKFKQIAKGKEPLTLESRKAVKKQMIIEIASIIFGLFASWGCFNMEIIDIFSGKSFQNGGFGVDAFLLFFFIAVIVNQIIKLFAYKKIKMVLGE